MKTVQEIALTPCYQHPLWDVTGPVKGEEVIAFQINFGKGKFLLFSEIGLKKRQCNRSKSAKGKHSQDSKVSTSLSIKIVFFFSPGLRINNSAERQEEVNHSCTFSIPFQPGML